MTEIPLEYREAVNTYEPVVMEGIKLYPIRVREYEAYGNARPALDFLQQSLPVRYLSMPLLSAFYAMDVENQKEGRPSDGLFLRALLFLVLALRHRTDLDMDERLRDLFRGVYTSAEDPTVLVEIRFEQDGKEHSITPVQFQLMRPVLAAQNGIKLYSTDANPELVETERKLAELNGPELDYDIHGLIASLATLTQAEEREIYDWPILKLNRRREALERVLQYLLCGISTAQGAQFKGGNPVPSPFFDRAKRDNGTLIDMGAVTGGRSVTVSKETPTQFQQTNNIKE